MFDKPQNCGNFALERAVVSHWYAARVRSRHEKFVADQLSSHDVQCYVPLVKHKAANRHTVESVLVPGYCFIEGKTQHRLVLDTVGVCGFVTFQKEPAEIMESEIEILKHATDPKYMAKEYTGFQVRQAVKIVGTPFDGYVATVDFVSGNRVRVILPVSIGKTFSVELLTENVEPLPNYKPSPSILTVIPDGVN